MLLGFIRNYAPEKLVFAHRKTRCLLVATELRDSELQCLGSKESELKDFMGEIPTSLVHS